MNLPSLTLLLLFFFPLTNPKPATIGINYGQLGNNLPSPPHSTHLLKTLLKPNFIKLYDANPQILTSLADTINLQVSIMLPNQLLPNVSSSQSTADHWIKTNLLSFYPKTNIRYVLIGNEILASGQDHKLWPHLVPAMIRIHNSLKAHNLIHVIKVSTPSDMSVLESGPNFTPSNGTFRTDISISIVKPMLEFLNRTKSSFYLDAYPYFVWAEAKTNTKNKNPITLDYALFKEEKLTYTDPITKLTYTNLFDQMLDSVIFAMRKLGFPDIPLTVAETGWPTSGDLDQIGANIYNAATYNRNLVRRLLSKPPVGTPARPGVSIPTIIFALFNENQKGGPKTERNWGLLYPNGTQVYKIRLTGKQPRYDDMLPVPKNNESFKGKIWCVVGKGMEKNSSELRSAMTYACGQSVGICDAVKEGRECFKKGDLVLHASYVFNSYWVKFRGLGGGCFFGGLALETIKDPSFGSCKFPSVSPTR